MNTEHWINLESEEYFILCLAQGKGTTFSEKHPKGLLRAAPHVGTFTLRYVLSGFKLQRNAEIK